MRIALLQTGLALTVLLVAAPALAQVGPFPAIGEQPASPLPKEDQQREARTRARARADAALPQSTIAPKPAPIGKLTACLATIDANPDGAADAARRWLAQAVGEERARAGQCLGSAQVALAAYGDARASFLSARDAFAADDHGSRARLGAMAANAALAGSDFPAGAAMFDVAHIDALASGDKPLLAGIDTDRARALVALKRDDDAAVALAEARVAAPNDAEAWLLSATLSRRTNHLAEAQAQIERAATLKPDDPDKGDPDTAGAIGVEAGVIAMLTGHEDAARRSWRSVIATVPQGPTAAVAAGYIAELDRAKSPGTAAAPPPIAPSASSQESNR